MAARALDFDPLTGNYKIFYFHSYRVLQVIDNRYGEVNITNVLLNVLMHIHSPNHCLPIPPPPSNGLFRFW